MNWNENLHGSALNIASCTDNSLRVMAGPGTGKTFAMKRRVARLLEEGVSPDKILAITFTRVAASDLLNELHNLNILGCEQIKAGTLHSFCFSILFEQDVFEFLGRNPRPLNYFTKSKVLKFEAAPLVCDINIEKDFGTARDCAKKIRVFEAAWARMQSENPGWPVIPEDRLFHEILINWLTFHKAILIGELVPLTLNYLRANPSSPVLSRFEHIIVDEYQDLNKAEQVLINFLINTNSNISIVGDSDQSIYSFRFAHPEGIQEFSQVHDPTRDEQLTECRRCPKRVVNIANYFINHNHSDLISQRLAPKPDNPEGELKTVQFNLLEEEIDGISKFVHHLINNRGYSPGDILILSPRRKIGCSIKDRLIEMNVTTHSYYNEETIHTDEAQEALNKLSLFINIKDRVALRWYLGHGSNTWLNDQYSRLRKYSIDNSLDPIEVLEKCHDGQLSDLRISRLVERYCCLVEQISEMGRFNISELIDYLFPSNDENMEGLRSLALSIKENVNSISDLYKEILLNITQPEIPSQGNFVRIMSIHKSKGLTSKVVIISGCIQSLIPFIDGNHSEIERIENLREQRRLFYVGITRCKEILVLTSSRMLLRDFAHQIGAMVRRGTGPYGQTIMSEFINELGPDAPQPISGNEWLQAIGL